LGNVNQGCTGLMYAWTPGGNPLNTPLEAGFLMGKDDTATKWVILEIHYNNANADQGMVDSSGVTITYTPQLRQYSAGILMLGDAMVSEYPIAGAQPNYHIETDCPEDCTSQWPHNIQVFADMLHMHGYGSMMWTTQWRNGARLEGFLNRVEFWQFDFQSFPTVNRVIQPGDRVNTHCVYDTSSVPANQNVTFGGSSSNEMCMEFVAYYPRLLTTDRFGKRNIYGYCGKFRGIYKKGPPLQPLPNPNQTFATVCGDLQFPETFLWTPENITVANPTKRDPPGDIQKQFGRTPASCAAHPSLQYIDTVHGSNPTLIFALGVGSALVLFALLGAVFFQLLRRSDNHVYQPLEERDQ